LPANYPQGAPLCYLDEQESTEVIEMIDYLDKGNRIMFDYLIHWSRAPFNNPNFAQTFNLTTTLVKIYNLFLQMPPLGMDELFGAPAP